MAIVVICRRISSRGATSEVGLFSGASVIVHVILESLVDDPPFEIFGISVERHVSGHSIAERVLADGEEAEARHVSTRA